MDCKAISFDILHTPVVMFERFASMKEDVERFARHCFTTQNIECAPLSTCNRIEFYFAVNGGGNGASATSGLPSANDSLHETVREFLTIIANGTGFSVDELKRFGRFIENKEVVEHLFSTVAGLNSIAIGETQIQGQVKDAYLSAKEKGLAGKNLTSLFDAALHAGKRARAETKIEQARISLGNLAIRSLQETGAFTQGVKTVIVGAGKMARNAAEYLLRNGISSDLVFLTRHPEKRREQLACFAADVRRLDSLPEHLKSADLIFSAYGTNELFVTKKLLQEVAPQRKKPLNLIDIAMPRDVDPEVVELPQIRLIDFFELEKMKSEHLLLNADEITAAEKIVAQEIDAYLQDQKLRAVSSTISHFRSHAES
ncbi:MAG: glutamyl-tRNA reductase, partial [bacterium]